MFFSSLTIFNRRKGGKTIQTPPFILSSNPYYYHFPYCVYCYKKIEITKMLFKITLSLSHYIRNIKQTLRFISNYQALLSKIKCST